MTGERRQAMAAGETARAPWYAEDAGFFGQRYMEEYVRFITPERTAAQVDFLEKVLNIQPGAKILDLACGHGRHSVEFARRGYQLTGQDLNSFFLKEAEKSANEAGVNVRWVQSDMRRIPFENEFDAVVNLFSSFGYLESDEEDQLVIHQVAKALRRGGQFFLDMISRDGVMRRFQERDWTELADGSVVLHERAFDFGSGRNYERRQRIWTDGKREEVQIISRMYTSTELIHMCKAAGLKATEVYGDYNGEALGLDSRRCIVIAEKED